MEPARGRLRTASLPEYTMSVWPHGFRAIPDEDWSTQPLGELARKYDTVEGHGWYDNLDRTVEQIAGTSAMATFC